MRRWIAASLITVLMVTSSAPTTVRAQSTPLIGGGLTGLPTTNTGPNLVQNPGFEIAGPASWPAGGWSQDQVIKHSGTFSFRRDSGGTSQQLFQLKAGTYKASAWIKTSNLGSGTSSGARLTLDFRPGGINAWMPSDVISGTNDWKLIEIGPIVVDTDRTAGLQLEMYNGPSGQAWFDDVTLTQIMPSSVEVFLLYPNFRGMLFDDGPSTMKFDVKVTPPGNDFARYGVTGTLKDEATGQVVASQTYAAAASFVADLEGGAMQPGRGYLATFALVDKSAGNAVVSTYPAYRVSRASAAARSAMNVSFDAKNRVLIKGVPRFILGVYDSGSGYSAQDSFWENQLWSPTGERRMDGMNINMYLNYWYGEAPADAMKALMANLQKRGVTYLQTGNCFDKWPADGNFLINSSDAYVQDLGSQPGSAGYYTVDECIASMVPGAFAQYDRLRRLDPDSITFSANFGNSDLVLWRDSADIISTDPYPLFGAEPSGGYNHKQVADWTAASRNVVKDARPIMTVLQFFKFTSSGRFPTLQEMRGHAYMAIVEGARGLWWWSLGDNALLAVCSGWCAEKTTYMNNLKSVVNEVAALEPALLADDSPGSLTASSNPAIKTKVKIAGGKGYVFAYNSTNTSQSATFGWNTAPGTVTVNAENRTLGASGNSFSDNFGPYQAHVYVIGSGGTGGTPTPTNPTVAFSAPAANATVSGTTTVTLQGAGGSGSGYTYGLTVDGTALTGTGASFAWDTTKVANGSHTLTATVTDSTSRTGSATLAVNVSNTTTTPSPGPTPLTVNFTSPTNGATVTGTVSVNVAALGGSGTTYTYGLKADGVAVAGTGPAFSWDTTKLANGSHTLTATATDPIGGSGSASITVNVSNGTSTTPPPPTGTLKVYVTQPGGGATVSGTSWAVMWLAGSSGTANSYTLTLGGKPMGTTTTSSTGPVSMPFDTKLVVDGSQPLMATVKDATGNTGGSTVNVNVKNGITSAPAPTPTLAASFTNPAAGATISGTASVDMSVTGSTATSRTFRLAVDGTVVSTQTVGGSTASYALNTAGLSNAAHTLSLTVTDSAGGSASAARTVTVSNVVVTPLSASITAPASGATVSGTSTVGMASAGGSTSSASRTYSLAVDGSVVSTQALSGATASYAWNTASVTNGSHTLTLTVTDGAGGSASASSTVTVSNVVATPPPTTGTVKVYITQPTNTATVGGTTWAVIWIAGQSGSSNSYTLTANGKVVASTVTSSAGPVALPWVTNGTANGAATLTATVKDATGNTGVGSINVTVSN
jgi:Big-like domain-containing protein